MAGGEAETATRYTSPRPDPVLPPYASAAEMRIETAVMSLPTVISTGDGMSGGPRGGSPTQSVPSGARRNALCWAVVAGTVTPADAQVMVTSTDPLLSV